jgi:hypothetical protein
MHRTQEAHHYFNAAWMQISLQKFIIYSAPTSHISMLSSHFYWKSLIFIERVYVFLLFVHVFLTLSMYSYCCLCILIVVYVFLLLSMYSYCSSMYFYRCLCIFIVVYVFLDAATLTGFSVFFPRLYGKCQGITSQDGARPALFQLLCCSMYCLFCIVLCIVCV